MSDIASVAADYRHDDTELVKAGCLEVASSLGDLMRSVVIVGGYVPTLLIDIHREEAEEGPFAQHIGTRDLDLAFAVSVMEDKKYAEISKQLRQSGFEPDVNEKGNPTLQRWKFSEKPGLKLDFLIPPLDATDEGGSQRHLEEDFAATIVLGLGLANENYIKVELDGKTLRGASARCEVKVCSAEAFLVLKGLAMGKRGKDKDDYDAFYILRNHSMGVPAIAHRFATFIVDGSVDATQSLDRIRQRYEHFGSVGPVAITRFVDGTDRDQAAAFAFVRQFIDTVDQFIPS